MYRFDSIHGRGSVKVCKALAALIVWIHWSTWRNRRHWSASMLCRYFGDYRVHYFNNRLPNSDAESPVHKRPATSPVHKRPVASPVHKPRPAAGISTPLFGPPNRLTLCFPLLSSLQQCWHNTTLSVASRPWHRNILHGSRIHRLNPRADLTKPAKAWCTLGVYVEPFFRLTVLYISILWLLCM